VIEEHRARRRAEGKRVLGVKGVLRQRVFQARFTQRSACPLCHTRVVSLFVEFKRAYFAFVAQYKAVSSELRVALAQGEAAPPVIFPEGGVPLFGGG
jgi:hypothetical protein